MSDDILKDKSVMAALNLINSRGYSLMEVREAYVKILMREKRSKEEVDKKIAKLGGPMPWIEKATYSSVKVKKTKR